LYAHAKMKSHGKQSAKHLKGGGGRTPEDSTDRGGTRVLCGKIYDEKSSTGARGTLRGRGRGGAQEKGSKRIRVKRLYPPSVGECQSGEGAHIRGGKPFDRKREKRLCKLGCTLKAPWEMESKGGESRGVCPGGKSLGVSATYRHGCRSMW